MMLRDRTGVVLRLLVDEYVNSAIPVASEIIARRAPMKVSPATVRNEMAELEDLGYILRSHVSSGSVPSYKGYRFYVESITEDPELPDTVRREVESQLTPAMRDMESWTHQAASALARLSNNMAIVTTPKATAARFKYLQLVQLQEFLALLVVVLKEARLRQHLLPLNEPTTQDQLNEVALRLNETFAGLTYHEIQSRDLPVDTLEESIQEDLVAILRGVEVEDAAAYCVDGLRLLFDKPEFGRGHTARIVIDFVEDPSLIRTIVSKAPEGDQLGVFIGEENPEEVLHPFGVILCQYGIPGQASGVLGVVGPTRMEYPAAMGGVRFLASFLNRMVASIYGTA